MVKQGSSHEFVDVIEYPFIKVDVEMLPTPNVIYGNEGITLEYTLKNKWLLFKQKVMQVPHEVVDKFSRGETEYVNALGKVVEFGGKWYHRFEDDTAFDVPAYQITVDSTKRFKEALSTHEVKNRLRDLSTINGKILENNNKFTEIVMRSHNLSLPSNMGEIFGEIRSSTSVYLDFSEIGTHREETLLSLIGYEPRWEVDLAKITLEGRLNP